MQDPLRVTLAIDGSESALGAARCWAAWHGGPEALRIVLLTVASPPPHFWAQPGVEILRLEQALLAEGERQLLPAQQLFAATALQTESRVRIGPLADSIVAEAEQGQPGLIVMGTRGLSPTRGLLVGSVAQRVVQSSRVPVWPRPTGARSIAALGQRLRVLCPVDGSAHVERAVRWLAAAAPIFGAVAVELFSVQPAFTLAESLFHSVERRIDHWSTRIGEAAIAKARGALPETGLQVDECVGTGETIEEILLRADEIGADAIVLGTRGLGAVGRSLLGSVSSGLLQTGRHTLVLVP